MWVNTGKVGFSSVFSCVRNRVVVLKQQVFREGMKVSMLLGQKGLDSQVEQVMRSMRRRPSDRLCPPVGASPCFSVRRPSARNWLLCHITGMREMLRKFSSKSAWFVDPLGPFRADGCRVAQTISAGTDRSTETLIDVWFLTVFSVWVLLLPLFAWSCFVHPIASCVHTDLLRGFCVAPSVLWG